jgi:hypothetical protein
MVAIADDLAPDLRPNYYVEVETRTYRDQEGSENEEDELLIGIPDAAVLAANTSEQPGDSPSLETRTVLTQNQPQSITLPMPVVLKERYLAVREVGSEAVITVIEVLSPMNKRRGQGRTAYERKRGRVLGSLSHLIEIDLLRGNAPMPMTGQGQTTDYRIVVSRSDQRPKADLYGFNLPEVIPSFPLPLKLEDKEPIVDLQAIVQGVYDRGSYDFRIDYHQPVPPPKLSEANQKWVDDLLASIRGV